MAEHISGTKWPKPVSGSGITLDNIAPTVYNFSDGSWSLFDPDDAVDKSYGVNGATFSSGVNMVKFKDRSPALAKDFNFGVNGDHRAPRYYRLLKLSQHQMIHSDRITFRFRMEWDGVTDDFNVRIVAALCQDPTALAPDTIAGAGGLFEKSQSGSASLRRPIYGGWSHDTVYSISNAGQVSAIAVGERGPTYTSGIYFQAYNSAGAQNGSAAGLRGGHYTGFTLSGDVYEMVGFGTRNNNEAYVAGEFAAIKVSLVAMGVV